MNRFPIEEVFSRGGPLRPPPPRALAAEARALLFDHPAPPDPARLPDGGGQVALVIPAFLTGDWATAPFRRFLRRCGFQAPGWELGTNWGPIPRILYGLRERLETLAEDGPVSLVGVSLGGLLARDLAHSRPQLARQVITLASPFRLPTAATIEPLFHLVGRFYSPEVDVARLARPLPVPELAIFTPDDGIVAWQTCRPDGAAGDARSVQEVRGAHVTICRNPQVMAAVVRRLAAVPDGPG